MEAGDASSLRLWSSLRRLSLLELNSIYARLNVEFDVVEGESNYGMRANDFRLRMTEEGWLQESTKKGMEGQVKHEGQASGICKTKSGMEENGFVRYLICLPLV